jgi:hypothetical protein
MLTRTCHLKCPSGPSESRLGGGAVARTWSRSSRGTRLANAYGRAGGLDDAVAACLDLLEDDLRMVGIDHEYTIPISDDLVRRLELRGGNSSA